MDTGSSGIWNGITGCSGCPVAYPLYSASTDSACSILSSTDYLSYGSGSLEGNIMSNTIAVGGSSVTVTMLGVTSANGFSNQALSGLIGLAPSPMPSSYNLALFMNSLVS